MISISSLGLLPRTSALLTASISAGTLQGGQCANTNATAFQTIPYALPPIGDLRFAPPLPYNSKFPNGKLNATVVAPGCPQFISQFVEVGAQSEDRLVLNVWVPPTATPGSDLPVKVWIYGGGEDGGKISDPLYDGLGPLGFLALKSAGIQGNMGIQDILLGLQWVQDNIGAFGGDPKKVLLFGQSAGADNVFVISTLPQAPSLFKAAITESGGGRDAKTNNFVQAQGANYSQKIGCSVTNIRCLRSKTPAELNNTLSGTIVDPYVDGKIIPVQPSEVDAKDATFQELGTYGSPNNINASAYSTYLQREYGPAANLVAKKYPISLFNHTPYPGFFAYDTVDTASNYFCPTYRGLRRAHTRGIPAWTYLYNHTLSCPWEAGIPNNQSVLQLLGPTHTMEIPLVFGNLDHLPLPGGRCNLTAPERAISDGLIAAWISMAESADPSKRGALVAWPQWEPTSSLGLVINENASDFGVVDYSVCAFWDEVNAMMLDASNTTTTMAGTLNASSSALGTGKGPDASSTVAFTGGATGGSAAAGILGTSFGHVVELTVVVAVAAVTVFF